VSIVTEPTLPVAETPVTVTNSVTITLTLPTDPVIKTASLPTGSNPYKALLSTRDVSGLGLR
jgi:hypothetical protein